VRKVYYLSTCSTSKRIIDTLKLRNKGFDFQDIKFDPVSDDQLAEMYKLAGSYEALFSKIARKYKVLGLKDQNLQEVDFKKYILQEYTFLKRPVVIIDDKIFIGSGKANVATLAQAL
jgi:arsenate reductase (glutaredoxin)